MGLLADLLAESESRSPAPAPRDAADHGKSQKSQESQPLRAPEIIANLQKSQESQESQATGVQETAVIRDRLLALTAAEHRDPALVRTLSESFLRELRGMDDDALRALLSMLADDADRRALKQPREDTAAILCRKCGPVWVHPSIAAVLTVVDGWPRALGCPWCFIHPKDGRAIPRPSVTCDGCRHYLPDAINPAQGMGRCAIEAATGTTWPYQSRICAAFEREAPAV